MSDLFKEVLPSLFYTKKTVIEKDGDYVPHVINKILSYQELDLFHAQEMNYYYNLPLRLQHDYMMLSLRKGKRDFNGIQWKKPVEEDVEAVAKFFGFSKRKALDSLNILSKQQLAEIREHGEVNG